MLVGIQYQRRRIVRYEIRCPKCQAIRVIEEDDNYEGFVEVPCLKCGNRDNPIFVQDGEVYYENREANIASGFRDA